MEQLNNIVFALCARGDTLSGESARGCGGSGARQAAAWLVRFQEAEASI